MNRRTARKLVMYRYRRGVRPPPPVISRLYLDGVLFGMVTSFRININPTTNSPVGAEYIRGRTDG